MSSARSVPFWRGLPAHAQGCIRYEGVVLVLQVVHRRVLDADREEDGGEDVDQVVDAAQLPAGQLVHGQPVLGEVLPPLLHLGVGLEVGIGPVEVLEDAADVLLERVPQGQGVVPVRVVGEHGRVQHAPPLQVRTGLVVRQRPALEALLAQLEVALVGAARRDEVVEHPARVEQALACAFVDGERVAEVPAQQLVDGVRVRQVAHRRHDERLRHEVRAQRVRHHLVRVALAAPEVDFRGEPVVRVVVRREDGVLLGVPPELDGQGLQLTLVIQVQQAARRGSPAPLLDAVLADLPVHPDVVEDFEVEQEDALGVERTGQRGARRQEAPDVVVGERHALRQTGDERDVEGAMPWMACRANSRSSFHRWASWGTSRCLKKSKMSTSPFQARVSMGRFSLMAASVLAMTTS